MAQKSKPLPSDQKIVVKSVNEIDLFVKLKYESSTITLFVSIRYSMRTYFLTSVTIYMPDPQTSDMRQIRLGLLSWRSSLNSCLKWFPLDISVKADKLADLQDFAAEKYVIIFLRSASLLITESRFKTSIQVLMRIFKCYNQFPYFSYDKCQSKNRFFYIRNKYIVSWISGTYHPYCGSSWIRFVLASV